MVSTLQFGRYELAEALTGGALATVYRARDRVARRDVVLKWSDAGSELTVDLELSSLTQLDHPGIVPIEAAFDDVDHGRRVLVESWVDGIHLNPAELDDSELREVALLLVDALTMIHRRGIRHGDIKPANILVERTESGPRPVIIDFGLATRADDPTFLGGTPAYLAPEFSSGGVGSPAADWWALGRSLKPEDDSPIPHDVEPLVDAMLLSDPSERMRRLQDVVSLSPLPKPTRLPRRLPTMAGAESVVDGARTVLARLESRSFSRLHVTGDDAEGRSAWLSARIKT